MNIKFDANGFDVLGLKESDNVAFSVTPIDTVESGHTVNGLHHFDLLFDGVLSSGVSHGGQITIDTNPSGDSISYGVLEGGGMSINSSGLYSYDPLTPQLEKTDNHVMEVIADKTASKKVSVTGGSTNILSSSTFTDYEAGSLAKHCQSQLESLVSGLTSSLTTQEVWLSNNSDVNAPNVVKNTNNFADSIDLTGISITSDAQQYARYPAMLISDRHALIATHIFTTTGLAIGGKHAFKDRSGGYQTRTILDFTPILNDAGIATDLCVIYYDAPITNTKIFEVMPQDWRKTYSPSATLNSSGYSYAPQDSFPCISQIAHDSGGDFSSSNIITLRVRDTYDIESNGASAAQPEQTTLNFWYYSPIEGDSSAPCFLLLNGEAALLGVLTSTQGIQSIFSTTDISVTKINTAMNEMAGVTTYAVVHPDLSAFNTYP